MFKKFKLKIFIFIILYIILLIPLFQFGFLMKSKFGFLGGILGKILFIYFVFWKIIQLITLGVTFPGIFIVVFLVFILFDGMLATFQYHKSRNSNSIKK